VSLTIKLSGENIKLMEQNVLNLPIEPKVCEVCHFQLSDNFYFCPNCGRKLKITPPSMSIATLIGIFALSLFIPPLGLWPAYKYLKQPNQKAKTIGFIIIALTIISLVISVVLALQLGQSLNKQINDAYIKYGSMGGY
jgi:hypothetical protein